MMLYTSSRSLYTDLCLDYPLKKGRKSEEVGKGQKALWDEITKSGKTLFYFTLLPLFIYM
jgi:hypothetical protein